MARVEIIMPQLGESIAEGTVVKWLKAPGDKVGKDESVLEITTDKVDSEIPSPAAGILVEIVAPEGMTVGIGKPLGILETEAGAAAATVKTAPISEAAKSAAVEKPAPAPVTAATPAAKTPAAPPPAAPATMPSVYAAPAGAPSRVDGGSGRFYSPLVRRIAREEGVSVAELDHIRGSGLGGRVNKYDILGYLEERKKGGVAVMPMAPSGIQAAPQFMPMPTMPAYAVPGAPAGPPPTPAAYRVQRKAGEKETRIPWDNVRRKIAEHMVRSKQVSPHVTSCTEADVTNMVNFREAYKGAFEASQGFKLTYTPFFVQAVVRAIQDFPMVNSVVDGESLVVKHSINLGLAVAMEDGGLIVPVVKNAEEKNFVGLARAADDLGRRAKAKKLVPDDVAGGTFTITNPGVFGGLWGTPIINQPQVAIFGMGAIQKRPVVINNMIAIRDMIYLTLSYDHRVIDGALSVQFLERVSWYLENFNPTGQIPGVI
jgi:2-oxoglutarate dehydrogenase E2 component (dihydrolipoamide succinyltransferase)